MITFVNAAHGRPLTDMLVFAAYDRLLGLPPVPWSERALGDYKKGKQTAREARKKANLERVPNAKPSHPLAEYAGTFEHPAYGKAVVSESGGKLTLAFHGITLPLDHYHYDRFQPPDDEVYSRWLLPYETNAQGNLDKLKNPLDEQEATFIRKPDTRLSEPVFLAKLTGSYEFERHCNSGDGKRRASATTPTRPAALRPGAVQEHDLPAEAVFGRDGGLCGD